MLELSQREHRQHDAHLSNYVWLVVSPRRLLAGRPDARKQVVKLYICTHVMTQTA